MFIHVKNAGGKIDGIGIRLKCEKQNKTKYSESVDVITTLKKKINPKNPTGVTALRVFNLTPNGSQHLRKRLQDPVTFPAYKPTYPIDVEDTHLSVRRGKYMVVIDVKQKDIVKQFLDQELKQSVYQNTLFDAPPAVIEDDPPPTRPRQDTDDASEITMDPYAGMIDLQPANDPPSVATDPSTMTFAQRRQKAIDDLPAPCVVIDFDASKLSLSNPPTSFVNAAKGTKSQGTAHASTISQLTQLTAENSKLQDEVSSLKQSLQDQDDKFQSVLEATKADHKAAMDAKDSDFRRLEQKLATIEETAEEYKRESEDRHQLALTAAIKEARDLHSADSEKKEQMLFNKLQEQFADQFNLLNNRLDDVNNDLQLSNQRNAQLRDELTAKNQELNAMKATVQILLHKDQPSPSSPNRKKRFDDTSSDMQDSIDASNPARSALSSDPRL